MSVRFRPSCEALIIANRPHPKSNRPLRPKCSQTLSPRSLLVSMPLVHLSVQHLLLPLHPPPPPLHRPQLPIVPAHSNVSYSCAQMESDCLLAPTHSPLPPFVESYTCSHRGRTAVPAHQGPRALQPQRLPNAPNGDNRAQARVSVAHEHFVVVNLALALNLLLIVPARAKSEKKSSSPRHVPHAARKDREALEARTLTCLIVPFPPINSFNQSQPLFGLTV